MGGKREKKGHLVLVPCPLQGHMKPMLCLAELLHSQGFLITIIIIQSQTISNPIPSCHPQFSVESIDGLSDYTPDTFNGDVVTFLLVLNTKCKTLFHDCLARMQKKSSIAADQDPILCIIHDAVMYSSVDIADALEIPRIVLRTSSATNFYGLSLLMQQGTQLPNREQQLDKPLKEIPFLRVKDMPVFNKSHHEAVEKFFCLVDDGTKTASAIIWNSLNCLEQTILDKTISSENMLAPMFPIGPLHKHSKAAFSNVFTEEQGCIISWLDTQKPNSVIYVSTGSLITISEHELVEMAWGLANSEQPFLWVIRPNLINGLNGVEFLPKELKKITRGRIISWAPQQQVLAHKSIGAFWTHNGWNSTIESISEGVPMLCWPCQGDQKVNARLVSHCWRVGIQLEEHLERTNIVESIKRLLVDKEGKEIKRRAVKLKEKIDLSLREGGPSCEFIGKLVSFIKLL